MRLICPNCAAQYEVDAVMIPDTGRDVQCSSCGHTWFQSPEAPAQVPEAAEPEAAPEVQPDVPAEPDLPPEPELPPAPVEAPAEAAVAPKARPIDKAALEILRQEAAREAEARRREAGSTLESQPDLGLDDGGLVAQSRAAAAKARLARLRDKPAAPPPEPAPEPTPPVIQDSAPSAAAAASRRELLPDIEEINSTLTPTGERDDRLLSEDDSETDQSRRGFRAGFFTVFGVMAILIGTYLFAPALTQAVPALTPALVEYLAWANGVLDHVDSGLRVAIEAMNGLISGGDDA